jgi:hypothetical protein
MQVVCIEVVHWQVSFLSAHYTNGGLSGLISEAYANDKFRVANFRLEYFTTCFMGSCQ